MPEETSRIYFKYYGDYSTQSVDLVGDFNQWKDGVNVLSDDDGDNIWEGFLDLPAGRFEYKFLVNKIEYKIDGGNPETCSRDGNVNSVIETGLARSLPDISFDHQWIDEYKRDFLYLKLLVSKKKYSHTKLILIINEQPKSINGYELYQDEFYSYTLYQLRNASPINEFIYYFELFGMDNKAYYFGRNGISESEWEVEHFEYNRGGRAEFSTPQWVKNAVFYQIFPESFYEGGLAGIITRTPYLKGIGIDAVYFNPIFEAPSVHKYDTSDYMKIDPHFGGDTDFEKLSREFGENGIRFILDGVFNHTGTSFFAFRDIVEKGEKSRYRDWYIIRKFPLVENGKPNYECWWDFASLPKLNNSNPEVQQYLFTASEKWLKAGASGWRLDVPNEIGHLFWKEFRKRVKDLSPDNYIVGEIWKEPGEWLGGDEFDAVMNYPLRDACVSFFARREKSAEDFAREIGSMLFKTPMQANFAMLNLLSSHDTARFYSVCGRDELKLKLALAFLFTFPGAPCIYYGEEIGMTGGKDPDNRNPMIWDKGKWDKEIHNFYKKMIRIRRENPILMEGDFRFIYAEDMVIGYERFTAEGRLIIFINNSQKKAHIDVTRYFGNGDFTDISKDHALKRKKAYALYEYEFIILKKLKDR